MGHVVLPRTALLAAVGVALLPVLFAPADTPKPAAKPEYFTGKVLPLADVLAKSGLKIDQTAAARLLALVTSEGKVYPLRNEDSGRMFYSDKALLNRPMRLTARVIGDDHFLQVFQVHSLIKGELHEVYYWCDVCTIKRFEKKDCECCGAPMERREEPVKK
jgi:hypothetical protein